MVVGKTAVIVERAVQLLYIMLLVVGAVLVVVGQVVVAVGEIAVVIGCVAVNAVDSVVCENLQQLLMLLLLLEKLLLESCWSCYCSCRFCGCCWWSSCCVCRSCIVVEGVAVVLAAVAFIVDFEWFPESLQQLLAQLLLQ